MVLVAQLFYSVKIESPFPGNLSHARIIGIVIFPSCIRLYHFIDDITLKTGPWDKAVYLFSPGTVVFDKRMMVFENLGKESRSSVNKIFAAFGDIVCLP